ncbi:MAG: CPBP family intramembrane glutamic endopeptidase [Flavobacteriales bacterium]
MEDLSTPATEQGDSGAHGRPPGLEFAMGVALFSMVLLVFMLVQFVVMLNGVLAVDPTFGPDTSLLDLIRSPDLNTVLERYLYQGDIIARTALWSGVVGTLLIVCSVYLWKRGGLVDFLGLRMASMRQFFLWTVAFLLLAMVLELLMRMVPSFQTDFMERVLGSSTDRVLLAIGVGLMAPLFEEFLLRGLLLGSIRHITDAHSAVALSAGVFTLMHLQYSWTVMLLILPLGVVLGYARVKSGSIWVPVLLHVINNMATVLLG